MEIIISGKDQKLIKLVEELATELGLTVSESNEITKDGRSESDIRRSEKLYQLMEEMAASGAFKSIKDPVAWQKEQRKDRPLHGRD